MKKKTSHFTFLILIFFNCNCGQIWGGITYVRNFTGYNGVQLVQAFGDAPNAPLGSPTTRMVNITWLEFTSGAPNYGLLRVQRGGPFNSVFPTTCTAGQIAECLVCTATFGSVTHTCSDTLISPSPAQYDYLVAIQNFDGTYFFPSPDQAYRITVPIPPTNMVLVQQDAANFEMCQFLGKSSDPLNHQRCRYTGLGAVPFNTNPGNPTLHLDSNYYDFGYNLFVDRWTAGCQWTTAGNGGMCAAGPAGGDCYGNIGGAPNNATQGANGNVFYDTNAGGCYVKVAGTWQSLNSGVLTAPQLASAYTIDPGSGSGKNPPLVQIDAANSWAVCQAIQDPNYGAKRLMRRREYISASAFPYLTGEPGAMTDAQIDTLEAGNGHTGGVYSCDGDNGAGVVLGAFTTTDLAGDILGGGILSFVTGSLETSQCVSRFGAQDLVSPVGLWMSDEMNCDNVSHKCFGTISDLDSGNSDISTYNFDGVIGPGGLTGGQTAPTNYTDTWSVQNGIIGGTTSAQGYGAGYFSPPLGLPMVGTDNGNALLMSPITAKFHNDLDLIGTDEGVVARSCISGNQWALGNGGGRWLLGFNFPAGSAANIVGFRCAVPAQ